MPRLRVFSGAELRALLESHGFVYVRQKGSHMILQRRIDDRTYTVPVPDHKTVKIGTLQSIIRLSGLERSVFETD